MGSRTLARYQETLLSKAKYNLSYLQIKRRQKIETVISYIVACSITAFAVTGYIYYSMNGGF